MQTESHFVEDKWRINIKQIINIPPRCLGVHGIKLSSQTQHMTSESQQIGMNRGIKKNYSLNNWVVAIPSPCYLENTNPFQTVPE